MPEIPESKLLAARRKAGVIPSPRKRKDPTEEDKEACKVLEAKAALAGRKVIPTLEPEEAIRNDTQYCLFRIDVARAARVANGLLGTEDVGAHTVGGPELLQDLGPIVAVDIETTAKDPLEAQIKCIGFDDGNRVVVLGPWTNAWSKDVGEFLGSRDQVVFHNGYQYDTLCLRKHGVQW